MFIYHTVVTDAAYWRGELERAAASHARLAPDPAGRGQARRPPLPVTRWRSLVAAYLPRSRPLVLPGGRRSA